MGANFTPTFDGYTGQQPFRYWCQTVLPLVYDDSLSYYELLNKVVTYLNNVITDVSTVEGNVDALLNAYQHLQNYVNDYFNNLDVQGEINNKLDDMAADGTLSQLLFGIYGNEITLKFATTVSEMTNTKLNYVLTPTSHVYTYTGSEWTDTGVIYGAVNNDTFLFRGVATGTTFASNSNVGFYRFTQTSLGGFSDVPEGLNNGGTLFTYKMATGGNAQTIIDTHGNSWFRLGTSPFVNTTQALIDRSTDPCLKNNGEVSGTTLASNSNIGFYNIPSASVTNFTDAPNGMQNGGTLFNYKIGTGGGAQTIIETNGNTWFRWGTNPFVNTTQTLINNSIVPCLKNNGEVTGTTLSSNSNIGFYRFTQAGLENLSDAPQELNHGGVLFNYTMATGGIGQTIIDTHGNSWFRLGTNPFVNTTQALINNSIVPCLKNNGEVSGTTLSSNSNIGFYNIPLASVTNFTDAPRGMNKGGTLFNYKMGSGVPGQTIIDIDGNTWFRWGTNTFVNIGKIMRDAVIKRDVTWYALGDSITQGYTAENGQISGVTQNNYVNTVAKMNGYTVTNYGTGGSGYVHNATVGDLLNARSKVDTINFADCDLVTLSFGVNDWHYDESIGDVTDNPSIAGTMCSNMKYCIEKILTDNPYAKIIVLTPINSSKFGGDFSTNWGLGYAFPTAGTLANIVDKQKQICEYYGIEYVDMTKCSLVNRFNITNVLGDGLHPTPELYPALGKDLASKINFK